MKPRLQSQAAECGSACLAMVANAQGKAVDLAKFPLKDMSQVERSCGPRTRQ
ncbi:MAG: hypothetical protein K2W93_08015 [Burkholderiaceae bacterium]|nr:hypothetical protein [Burkholderiaceae bacterium]